MSVKESLTLDDTGGHNPVGSVLYLEPDRKGQAGEDPRHFQQCVSRTAPACTADPQVEGGLSAEMPVSRLRSQKGFPPLLNPTPAFQPPYARLRAPAARSLLGLSVVPGKSALSMAGLSYSRDLYVVSQQEQNIPADEVCRIFGFNVVE